MTSAGPGADTRARVADILGWTPADWRRVHGGYTPAARWRVAGDGGRRAFVKLATTPLTARMLRGEFGAYAALSGPFMPRAFGWRDDPAAPLLVTEDLGAAYWPPPWRDGDVAAVLAAVETLHAAKADLPPFSEAHADHGPGWGAVAADPIAFLGLGLVSPDWLTRALPALVEAEAACLTGGNAPCHLDLRSDNLCLTESGVRLIDWAASCLSNPRLDLGFWLPSLAFEGGPPPDAVLPDAPEVAAWVSGFFAARAGLPDIPDAPFVRRVQREQLGPALAWAVRALKLEAV